MTIQTGSTLHRRFVWTGVICSMVLGIGVGFAAASDKKQAEAPPAPAKDTSAQKRGPVITVDEKVHDFGKVWAGDKLEHAFKITNAGNATLEITRVRTSCGCTVAGEHPDKLGPGESGLFQFSLKSKKLRGPFSKSITVRSNDPAKPSLSLKLRGECVHRIDVSPTAVRFRDVCGDVPVKRVVNITNNTDELLELKLEVPSTNDSFTFELVETVPGRKFELHVATVPPYETAMLRTTVTLKTNVDGHEEISLPVYGKVVDRLEVKPAEIKVRPLTGAVTGTARGSKRTVQFVNHGEKPVKLIEATVDDPAVAVTIKQQKNGTTYIIRLDLPVHYQPPVEGHTLTLKTDDPDQPFIRVPIRRMEYRSSRRIRGVKPTYRSGPEVARSLPE